MTKHITKHVFLPAAIVLLSAAVFGNAQQLPANKHNTRPDVSTTPAATGTENDGAAAHYVYEFTQPQFFIKHIVIEHDETGRGKISFEKLNEETPVVETIDLSPAAIGRIAGLWRSLRFLDSDENYQSDNQFPHLGTMRLKMEQGTRKRTAEFNWTNNKEAFALINEYRRAADQAMLVFDISVARESQPLNTPKLMDQFESMLRRNALSDPKQLIPLLKEISIDEHIPLIARNHALRLLKKIDK